MNSDLRSLPSLAAEIARHAVDLDRRHGFALANVGQRVGDVAEEAGQLVGRARADGRAAGPGRRTHCAGAAKRPWPHSSRVARRQRLSSGSLTRWRTKVRRRGLGVHGEEGRAASGDAAWRRRSVRRTGKQATSKDGRGSLQAHACVRRWPPRPPERHIGARGRPRAGQINSAFHTLVSLAQTNEPIDARPPRPGR